MSRIICYSEQEPFFYPGAEGDEPLEGSDISPHVIVINADKPEKLKNEKKSDD